MNIGLPPDDAAWIALALAPLAVAAAPFVARRLDLPRRARVAVLALAALATALSAAYVALYLRGGPRIIDATSYWLEARGFAHGTVAFPLKEPVASTLGRFLVRSDAAAGPRAAVIFPPGWPAVLALGFLAHAPLAVGPILAAAIVLATAELARRMARAPGLDPALARSRCVPARAAVLAAALSALCAALRYHTADTMSHGLAALCVAGALALALRALDDVRAADHARSGALAALGAGFAAGWLLATRPASALALGATLAVALAAERELRAASRARLAALAVLGAIPGALLLVLHQRAATGSFGVSSQSLYYSLSDGPADCFRYGFGTHVGCVGEHGDFVRARLANGYGALAALGTTVRRLFMHLADAGNSELFAAIVVAGAVLCRASRRARILAIAILFQVLAYAPFYFDGNYPGGGARFYADVIPVEHVLAALAVLSLAARARTEAGRARIVGGAVALVLAGLALRASFDHDALRDREGGRPMFEPARLAEAGVTRGLVFVDTDHGFDLAFDPTSAVDVVRRRGDLLDRLAWEARGRPPAFLYRYDIPEGGGPARVAIEPLALEADHASSIEGESLWPALAQRGAWALPSWASGTCASAARVLRIDRATDAPGEVALALPAQLLAGARLVPVLALGPGVTARVSFDPSDASTTVSARRGAPALDCSPAAPFDVPVGARTLVLRIRCEGPREAVCALDRVDLATLARSPARAADRPNRAGESD